MAYTWVEEEEAFNPNDIKYIFSLEGEEIFTIDFSKTETMR